MNEGYISPATDFGFKRLFGSEPNKILLIDFLNQLLPPHHHIHDLHYRKNEHPGLSQEEHRAIFDLLCESDTGEKFFVEFQRVRQTYFKDRTVLYSSFPLQEHALRGEWHCPLGAVYIISLLEFYLPPLPTPDVVTTVQLKDQYGQVFYDNLTFIYIELTKFTKRLEELGNDFERWLYLLRHLAELDAPPPGFEREPFEHLFEAAEMAKLNSEERLIYEDKLKAYRDLKNSYDTMAREAQEAQEQAQQARGEVQQAREQAQQAREQAQQAREQAQQAQEQAQQAQEQGRTAEKIAIAQQLKAHGLAPEAIAAWTGLTLDEISQLP